MFYKHHSSLLMTQYIEAHDCLKCQLSIISKMEEKVANLENGISIRGTYTCIIVAMEMGIHHSKMKNISSCIPGVALLEPADRHVKIAHQPGVSVMILFDRY